jgi:hypothetical protein
MANSLPGSSDSALPGLALPALVPPHSLRTRQMVDNRSIGKDPDPALVGVGPVLLFPQFPLGIKIPGACPGGFIYGLTPLGAKGDGYGRYF